MLPSSARRLQLTKERQHLTVRKKVRWCRAMLFQHFPKENVIFKNARISIPTTRVFGIYPRVRQICPQMEKSIFLETWKMNWGSAKATNHCGTFILAHGLSRSETDLNKLAARARPLSQEGPFVFPPCIWGIGVSGMAAPGQLIGAAGKRQPSRTGSDSPQGMAEVTAVLPCITMATKRRRGVWQQVPVGAAAAAAPR